MPWAQRSADAGRSTRGAVPVKGAGFTPGTSAVRLYLGAPANLSPCPRPGGWQLRGRPRALGLTRVPTSLESFLPPSVWLILGQTGGHEPSLCLARERPGGCRCRSLGGISVGGRSAETETEGKNSAGGFSTAAPAPSPALGTAAHVPFHLAPQSLVSLEAPSLPGTVGSSRLPPEGSLCPPRRVLSRPRASPERRAEGLPVLTRDLRPVSLGETWLRHQEHDVGKCVSYCEDWPE